MTGPAPRPQDTVEQALAMSRTDGCVVIATESSTANIRWAGNTLTTNGVAAERSVTVIATVGGSTGSSAGVVSRSSVDRDALEGLVRSAEEAARRNPAAEDAMPLVTASDSVTGSEAWDDEPAETGIGVFTDLAGGLGDAFGAARSDGRLLFGYAEHDTETVFVGTSTGLRARHTQPQGKVELNGKSADHARSVWAGRATRDFSDVDVAELDAEVGTRLDWAKRTVSLDAGRYETILPPSAIADLLVYAYFSASGREAAEGRNVYSAPGGRTRVGEALAAPSLTLRSDPSEPGLECGPFAVAATSGAMASVFDNGLALQPTDWIRDGQLEALVHTRSSAARAGLARASPGIDNLILESSAPSGSLQEMVAATRRGLLLTCLWYIREVDPQTLLLTGLTRDGVYLVEDGEISGAVNNFRFNESPVSLLGRITEIGAGAPTLPREFGDWFTRAAMPPVRVPDFNMSSVSQAL